MDFSEALNYSGPLPSVSPDGQYVAAAEGDRVVVRAVDSLEVVQLFSCLDRVRRLEWCCRSEYLLCQLRKPVVQVWCLAEPEEPVCRVEEGAAGVQHACWSPDGQHILTVADFQIRLAVWSLVTRACVHLAGPKRGSGCLAFSPDGAMLAVAERHECKDFVSLYACADWAPLAHAEVGTSDLEGLAFAPDGTCLAAWDSPLQYGVVVLALDGSPLARYRAYEDALGVKCASWAPSGQLLAVGSYDQEARLLDHASWLPAASLAHPEHLADAPAGFVAFREVGAAAPPARGPAGDAAKAGARGAVRVMAGAGRAAGEGAGAPAAQEQPRAPPATHYVVVGLPLRLPAARPVLDKPALRMGIGKALWSADGQFLATGNDAQPECVWLWSAARLALAAVVQQAAAVQDMAWSPCEPRLALVCGGPRLYLWSAEGASCVSIPPAHFQASSVRWGPSGGSLVIADAASGRFCCAYFA